MKRPLRHAAALGLIAGAVLSAYHLAAAAGPSVASLGNDDRFAFFGFDPSLLAIGRGYDLSALRNYQRTADYVRQQYVDPSRIDHAAAFASALDAVERAVPEVLLRLDPSGRRLRVEVGEYSDTLAIRPLTSEAEVVEELRRVAAILDTHLPEVDHKRPELEYALINGMLSTLDPHSVFLPPESSQRMEEDNEGAFGGLGLQVKLDKQRRLMVEVPLENTPAWRAGIQAGDRIVKIDGEGTLNMDLDEAVKKMRGVPGSSVTLTIDREEFAAARDFTVVRDRINQNAVWAKLLTGRVGYVRIDQFHGQVEAQLDAELARIRKEAGAAGLAGVVLDLRDNPGGFLHQAVAVADRFLAQGVIVSTVGRDGRPREQSEAQPGNEVADVPVAVLTSGNSASASEIVAGALKNSDRAVIIGERTFGKGSVQNLYPFADTSRLKLTIARYLTPGDHSIQGVGISPDIGLERAFVGPPKDVEVTRGGVSSTERSNAQLALFARDRLQREADLEGHFANTEDLGPPPSLTLRYLVRPQGPEPRTDRKDVTRDVEVQLAREVLVAAKGWKRSDVLRDAGAVVAARARVEEARVAEAFRAPEIGIDWSACVTPTHPEVTLALVVGDDGVLDAGATETVAVELTNRGEEPLCRAVAVATSGNGELDGVEFHFGKVAPGATVRRALRLRTPEGYPTETAPVSLELRDAERHTLGSLATTLHTRGAALPVYPFGWTFSDAQGGDGDGILEVGETVTITVDVDNAGTGTGGAAHVLLKKDASLRKTVEIKQGEATLHALAPAARGQGTLTFRVAEAPPEGVVRLELRVYDDERYDYGAIVKGGFWDWYTQSVKLDVPIGQPMPTGRRTPPTIRLSRTPDGTNPGADVTLSGTVVDDDGLRDVILYRGDQKIGYEGGGAAVRQVPFSATAALADGVNVLVVLARDATGTTSTLSVPVYHPPATQIATPTTTPSAHP